VSSSQAIDDDDEKTWLAPSSFMAMALLVLVGLCGGEEGIERELEEDEEEEDVEMERGEEGTRDSGGSRRRKRPKGCWKSTWRMNLWM